VFQKEIHNFESSELSMGLSMVMQGVSKRALQWYSKWYCVASVTKTFALKGVQTIRRSTQQHLEYHCEALFEMSRNFMDIDCTFLKMFRVFEGSRGTRQLQAIEIAKYFFYSVTQSSEWYTNRLKRHYNTT
jgi:hypothetical protein